jgi:dephospho-CoA kinase
MVRVALTGGIATGKSALLSLIQARGVPVIDADILARDVVAPGTPGLAAVVERFGQSVVGPDGALDRRRLAAIVFADAGARADLEAIIHPAVYRAIADWFSSLPPATPFAVADIPLLFETGHAGDFDRIVLAACSPEEQVRRVIARDNVTHADAEARLAAQWPMGQKVALADHVIWTTGTREETAQKVEELLELLQREATAGEAGPDGLWK